MTENSRIEHSETESVNLNLPILNESFGFQVNFNTSPLVLSDNICVFMGAFTYPLCGCCMLLGASDRGVLILGAYATGLMTGPELALPPAGVNGRAILLMAVLGAKEYLGCTEAGDQSC